MPDSWTICHVADLAQLVRGVTYQKVDAINEPRTGFAPLLRANNINGCINHDELVYVREARISDAQWLQKGDVLVAMSSGSINLVGKAAQVSGVERTTFGAFCGALRPTSEINQGFFGWFFQTRAYRESVSRDAKGSNINNLKRDHILEVCFPLPPLNEQRRIVEKIETLFARLDQGDAALRDVQTLLARYRQSVLKAAVTGQLTADWRAENAQRLEHGRDLLARILQTRRDTWQGRGKYQEPAAPGSTAHLPELPEGWVWASFDQLFDVYGGATPSRREPKNWGGDIPWVSSGEVAFCRIKETAERITRLGYESCSTRVHPVGTVLLAMIGEGKTRGQAAILDIPACNNQNAAAIRVSRSGIPSEYVYYFLMGRYEQSRKEGQGGNQPALNGAKIKAFLMPLPSVHEMREIAARIEEAFSISSAAETWCETELTRSAALRQSILKHAFAGRLVPQDPNDEPAAELLARIRSAREAAPKKTTRKKAQA